jgi:hypothetical protein
MSGIVGSKFNHRGSGLVGSLGTDGQHMLSSGAGKKHVFETVAVAAYDDEPIKSDLTALAIREATNESSAAFNLPSSFIETFTDNTNLGTETDGSISIGGYGYWFSKALSAASAATLTSGNFSKTSGVNWNSDASRLIDDDTTTYALYTGNPTDYNEGIDYDFGSSVIVTAVRWVNNQTEAIFKLWKIWTSSDDATYTEQNMTGSEDSSGSDTSPLTAADTEDWNTGTFTTAHTARYVRMRFDEHYAHGNANAGMAEMQIFVSTLSALNATATLIQSANTVTGERTEVGGTMLYADEDGTATLGTDLKIYFTCDGGSNWTETDTYTTITPVYASGIKQVRLGKTTCTGGTDVRYKAVWANQSDGSLETHLHGIGINY